jgi:hypothetical protein
VRVSVKAGEPDRRRRDLLVANLETLGAGGPQPRMPTSSELRFGRIRELWPAGGPQF